MDKPIKKNIDHKKGFIITFISLITMAVVFALKSNENTVRVNFEDLETSKVKLDKFEEIIAITATVEPENSFKITSTFNGKVKSINKENGDYTNIGDTLIILENNELKLDYMNKEINIIEQLSNLRNTKIVIENRLKSQKEALIDLEYNLSSIKLKFTQDSLLNINNAIAKNDFGHTKREKEFLSRKYLLAQKNHLENRKSAHLELSEIEKSSKLLKRNLNEFKAHINSLIVISDVEGVLESFNFNIGDEVQKGEKVAMVSNHSTVKATANVNEIYLDKIKEGLIATASHKSKKIKLEIEKIHPEVINNEFKVEFSIDSSYDLKSGQSLYLDLSVSEQKLALMIKKGDFYKNTYGKWIYVVDNNVGVKRSIKIGNQNEKYYEILSGLNEDEKVIIAGYNEFGNAEKLILN